MSFRFRRLDAYNYVIERARVHGPTIEGGPKNGQPNPRAGETTWEVETYHNRLDNMVKRALQDGIGGESLKEFAASLENAKKEVLDALTEAIEANGLSMHAYSEKRARSAAKAQETRKANEEARA